MDTNDTQPPDNHPTPPPFTTNSNSYGIYWVYPHGQLSYTPDELHMLQQVSDSSTFIKDSRASE
jgi:hypothetical protein